MSTQTIKVGASDGIDFRPDLAFRGMIRTFGLLRRVQEPFFNRFGITASQWGVLRTLHRAEQENVNWLRLTDLGNRLIIRPPSVTGVVDRLQRLGLLLRTSLPEDRRAKRVSLTPKGRELVVKVLAALPKQIESIVDVLSPDKREALKDLLAAVEGRLQVLVDRLDTAGATSEETEQENGNGAD